MFLGLVGGHSLAAAAAPPGADVTVSVVVTPSTFQPGSTGVIELTMHNNGPDTAGSNAYNLIDQKAFLSTPPAPRAPYVVLPGVTGCVVGGQFLGPNVDMLWGYIGTFAYPSIPAGESRTCRIPIQFLDQPLESFDTYWRISTNPEDPDLSNNQVNYRFIAAAPPATPVPALDRWVILLTALGLLALSARALRRRAG